MYKLTLIGLGGFVGAILRYAIISWIQKYAQLFPLGTLIVNMVGSFLLGIVMFSSEYKEAFSEEQRVFLSIGVLGAFTTMSTFSYETLKMIENNQPLYLILNVLGNVFMTILSVFAGRAAVLLIWK